jgi:hypothetical protein
LEREDTGKRYSVTSRRLRTPFVEMCREMGMRSFKVTNPVDLMGIRSTTEKGEMDRLLGEDPDHYTADGYVMIMARSLIDMVVGGPGVFFQAEKRERLQKEDMEGLCQLCVWAGRLERKRAKGGQSRGGQGQARGRGGRGHEGGEPGWEDGRHTKASGKIRSVA